VKLTKRHMQFRQPIEPYDCQHQVARVTAHPDGLFENRMGRSNLARQHVHQTQVAGHHIPQETALFRQ